MSDSQNPANPLASARAMLSRLVAAIRGMGKPAKILIATTVIAAIGIGGFMVYKATSEPYAVLFAQLSQDDAASVAAKLKELKVPYRVVDGGRIEVPEAKVHELRLEIAGAGLPRGGGVGFESFDKMRLGATEFEQRVMFRRAMEGELSRTISTISAVESARVHLVLPEKSVFVGRREPASASVVLKLRQGRELGGSEIAAVVHLVSSAVPDLSADHVALATTEGVLLKKPRETDAEGNDSAGDEENSAEAKALETRLEERARAIIERVVGPGHADVRVSAEMDFSKIEHTEDHFEPQKTVLRSEELSYEKQAGSPDDTMAGVPGAESNLPTGSDPEAGDSTATMAPGVVRHEHTRNYEVDRVTEKRTSKAGAIKRLAVAVVIDGVPVTDESGTHMVQRDPVEIDRLTDLVRSAVGADERRADVVTVDSIPFAMSEADLQAANAPAAPAAPAELPFEKKILQKKYWPFLGAGAGVILLVVVFAMISRRRRRLRSLRESAPATPLEAIALPDAPEIPKLPPRDEALRRAAEDPATAALVIRHWLGTAGEEQESEARAA